MGFNKLNTIEKAFWETAKTNFIDRYLIYTNMHKDYNGNNIVNDYNEIYALFGLPDDSFDKCLENFIYQSCVDLDCDCETNVVIDILNKNIIITIKTSDLITFICKIYKIEECLIIVDED